MAFESSRPFGFRSGFEPGREFASPFGTSRPEMLGLGDIGAAAQQASQFPVMAGGGGGATIPGLAQVEINGGPSQIGDTTQDETEGVLGGVARATRIADEPPPAGPAELALGGAAAAQRGGVFARDLSNLSAFSGAGSLPDFTAGTPGAEVSGGELGLDAPGAGTAPDGSSLIGTTGSGAAALSSLLKLLSSGGVGGPDLGTAGAALGGVSSLAQLASLANSGQLASLGGAASGAGALGAILGLLAQATGDPELAKASNLTGAASGAIGLGSTAASLAELAPLLGTATAAVPTGAAAGLGGGTAATGLAAGGAAGIGTAVGAAYAPIAALLLIDSLMQMAGSKDAPNLIGSMMGSRSITGDYPQFVPDLMQNAGQQGTAFNTLAHALPYVQSKDELGRLVNTYKNYIQTTTGIQLDDAQNDPYTLDAIPGVGPRTHGQATPPVDWGGYQTGLQRQIDALLTRLPGERITGGIGDPQGGGLSGPEGMRLWTQFLDRTQTSPIYQPTEVADRFIETGSGEGAGFGVTVPGRGAGFYTPGGTYSPEDYPTALRYGQEGYDYAGSGFPEPGKYLGEINPAYLEMLIEQAMGRAAAPSNTPGRAMVQA